MLLHYRIRLNKEKHSSDTSWTSFFFSRRWSFTSLQMDLKAYFGERKSQGNVVVNRSERVLPSRWLRGHLKQLRGRAEGNCALCPTVTHRSPVAIWSPFISTPVGQEDPALYHHINCCIWASAWSHEVQDLQPGVAFLVEPASSRAQFRYLSHGS